MGSAGSLYPPPNPKTPRRGAGKDGEKQKMQSTRFPEPGKGGKTELTPSKGKIAVRDKEKEVDKGGQTG